MATIKKTTEEAVETAKTPEFYIVEAPIKDYCGVGAAGFHFANGRTKVSPDETWILGWFEEHGYKVIKE